MAAGDGDDQLTDIFQQQRAYEGEDDADASGSEEHQAEAVESHDDGLASTHIEQIIA